MSRDRDKRYGAPDVLHAAVASAVATVLLAALFAASLLCLGLVLRAVAAIVDAVAR